MTLCMLATNAKNKLLYHLTRTISPAASLLNARNLTVCYFEAFRCILPGVEANHMNAEVEVDKSMY